MSRYHFEIVDGFKIEDPVGFECTSEHQARQLADDIARQIAIDVGTTAARKVVVIDDDGTEIYRSAVQDADKSG